MLRFFLFLLLPCTLFGQSTYTIQTKVKKADIPTTLWGLFFEDINRGADGGLYAELVKNRSFDFPKPLTGWTTWPSSYLRDGIFEITDHLAENPKDPKILHIETRATDTVGLINTGYDGMALKKAVPYTFAIQYRQLQPGIHVRIFLFNSRNRPIASTALDLSPTATAWTEQTVSLSPTDTTTGGKLLVIFEGAGKLEVDRLSLRVVVSDIRQVFQ